MLRWIAVSNLFHRTVFLFITRFIWTISHEDEIFQLLLTSCYDFLQTVAVSQLEKATDKKKDSAAKGDKSKAASNSKVEKEKLQKVSTAEKDGKKSQKKKTQTSAAKGDASKPSTSKFEVRFLSTVWNDECRFQMISHSYFWGV